LWSKNEKWNKLIEHYIYLYIPLFFHSKFIWICITDIHSSEGSKILQLELGWCNSAFCWGLKMEFNSIYFHELNWRIFVRFVRQEVHFIHFECMLWSYCLLHSLDKSLADQLYFIVYIPSFVYHSHFKFTGYLRLLIKRIPWKSCCYIFTRNQSRSYFVTFYFI